MLNVETFDLVGATYLKPETNAGNVMAITFRSQRFRLGDVPKRDRQIFGLTPLDLYKMCTEYWTLNM
jgi:hypothetical protein